MIFLPFHAMQDSLIQDVSQLELLKIVHSYRQPDWRLPSHSHRNQAELLFVANGKGVYTADNFPYHVEAGDIVIFNSDVVHSVESDLHQPLDVWSCAIRGFQITGLPPNHILPSGALPVFHTEERRTFVENLYQEIYRQRTEEVDGYYTICHSLIYSLFMLCIQLFQKRKLTDPCDKARVAAEIMAYLDKNYAEPISMESLSRLFHMSASHISHLMKAACNTSPINYLINRRIQQAQWELASTKYSLAEITLHVGYENANHFSNLFRSRTGMTPIEFRNKYTDLQ